MTGRGFVSPAEPYAPRRRTALVLTGTGTAGAYHAGVLRALHEAGVKLDVVAGRGVGAIGALFAAIDGAQRLWDDTGFWRAPAVRRLYVWRFALRVIAGSLATAVALVALPLGALAAGLIVFPIDFVLKMLGTAAMNGPADRYLAFTQAAFAPERLPTWLPRLVVLVLGLSALVAIVAGWFDRDGRRRRGPFWWRIVGSPLSAAPAVEQCWAVMWDLVRGAARLKPPTRVDLARRYAELLVDNLGQPGFRELFLAVHDLDARRDLVFAFVAEPRRRDLVRRPTSEEADARRAEVLDLAGVSRDHLADAVAASLAIPLGTEPHSITFAADGYWRGETHRLCDRPGSVLRLIEELARVGVEQVVLVTAAPESPGPHALAPPRLDGRGRIGEYLQSFEAAACRDAGHLFADEGPRLFVIRPSHNAVGPLDFTGGFDDRSDRRQGLGELMSRGYEDAYHQFIEPVVGASGERVGQSVP
jgi:predicted acylesterase/phospholipase RssA